MERLLWITHQECGRHEMGAGHPERPERLEAVERAVASSAVGSHRHSIEASRAPVTALTRVHEESYVEHLLASAPTEGYHRLDPDTAMNAHSAEAALRAAGAAVQAVDAVLGNSTPLAFCAVRPPGHHAERRNAMGFCLFGNAAVAAGQALDAGVERVAILDFDVHYGNGSVDIFRDHPSVMVCNTYQYPLYPDWPDGGGGERIVDAPLPPGAGSTEFRAAVDKVWAPALQRFAPGLILVSAGFDAHRDDPLAQLNLVEDDYHWMGVRIRDWAERYGDGRVVATLEGGYNLKALGPSAAAFLCGLMGVRPAAPN